MYPLPTIFMATKCLVFQRSIIFSNSVDIAATKCLQCEESVDRLQAHANYLNAMLTSVDIIDHLRRPIHKHTLILKYKYVVAVYVKRRERAQQLRATQNGSNVPCIPT